MKQRLSFLKRMTFVKNNWVDTERSGPDVIVIWVQIRRYTRHVELNRIHISQRMTNVETHRVYIHRSMMHVESNRGCKVRFCPSLVHCSLRRDGLMDYAL